MATVPDAAWPTYRERVERAALEKIAARLASQFPELPASEIARLIHGQYVDAEAKPIRDPARQ